METTTPASCDTGVSKMEDVVLCNDMRFGDAETARTGSRIRRGYVCVSVMPLSNGVSSLMMQRKCAMASSTSFADISGS
jgi:hypothetical protein